MTMGKRGDQSETMHVLKKYKDDLLHIDYSQESWLRHGAGTQATKIDWMILEGKFSIEEIADSIAGSEYGPQRSKEHRINRVMGHIRHLDDDSQNGKQKPHYLKIKELNDILFFG